MASRVNGFVFLVQLARKREIFNVDMNVINS